MDGVIIIWEKIVISAGDENGDRGIVRNSWKGD